MSDRSAKALLVITAIVPSSRPVGRFAIMAGDETVALLDLAALERLGLHVGASLEGRLELLADETQALATRDRALNLIAVRARSATELSRTLVRKGELPAHVARAIQRLTDEGYLDDGQFASAFARSRIVGSGHSRRRVAADLSRKGVARDVASAAIAQLIAEEEFDQGSLVEAAARKKLRTLSGVNSATRRRRLYGYLARRGYDTDDIRRAMDAVERGAAEG